MIKILQADTLQEMEDRINRLECELIGNLDYLNGKYVQMVRVEKK